MNHKFWAWKNAMDGDERILELNGTIAEDSWFEDDVTPKQFKEELFSGEGNITLWINSPGGDCIVASQIYTMLMDYPGTVTVKINGLAASAASVIAMAGSKVYMSPTAMLMIHNPMTAAFGNHTDFEKALDMLSEVKESIINAYEIKTSLPRTKLSHLMDDETWMNAKKAVELGFADGILNGLESKEEDEVSASYSFSSRMQVKNLINRIEKKTEKSGSLYSDLAKRLELLK